MQEVISQRIPTTDNERIISLDILRGFALCGILIVNIQSFSMIGAAYFNPTAYGNFEGLNWVIWFVTHLLADQKFITIFSMLFGAGIVLMWERAEAAGRKVFGLHFRRMILLLFLGLAHANLLWYGDILVLYSICGMLVYWFRKKKPVTLIVIGLLVFSVSSLINIAGGLSMSFWPPEQVVEMNKQFWQPPPEIVQLEIEAYRSDYLGQMARRTKDVTMMHTQAFPTWGLWRASGAMLIGMALFKLGFLSLRKSSRTYLIWWLTGLLIGLPFVGLGVYSFYLNDWHLSQFFLATQFNYWASLLIAIGWTGMVMLAIKKNWLTGLQERFAAVGKLAFTNYLLQSIICTSIFYGHGLGLYGDVSRTGQFLIVIAIWVFQLTVSPLWLRYFSVGPFEWLWRSMSYLKVLPIKR